MIRTTLIAILIASLAAVATADKLILTDGREFEGVVTTETDSVLIVMEYGSLRFPKNQVLRVELKDTPQEELAKRLAQVSANDPDALYSVGKWALRTGLRRRARDLFEEVLKLDPDHAGAREELGFVRINGKWTGFDAGIEVASGKLEAEQYAELLDELLPALERIARTRDHQMAVRELTGYVQLRAKKFTAAQSTFAELTDGADGARAVVWQTIATILKENPDGMYVLKAPYPPEARLLGDRGPVVPAGPASLSRPIVLEAAVRDEACKRIQAGRDLAAAAEKLETSKPAAAHAKFIEATQAFDLADALVPEISRSYRVEIARRRIAMIRRASDEEVSKFDAIFKTFSEDKAISTMAYRMRIVEMIRHLDSAGEPLKEILVLGKPYERELLFEVKQAEASLRKIQSIRDALTETLNARS